jgi:hypothetical protein
MPFLHSCGHKPLAGYTIKRGISKGGFGEVYFGLTDGGKEVALKRVVRHQDIELRGIRQCLNLKHPHLVHLYDLKTDERGDHWLVMEYIRGETLHSILQKNPNGLPHDLIRPWFEQLAGAIHCLHEQGIVHRDLKPANVFLENGLVKVGDYGLCKFIGGSQHRSQTHNVGTVHYMAPEIGKGDYSRPIDIYAAGILLYEMATGKVPFDGETTGEILFKHLSATPDLTNTGEFAPIIATALAKEPGRRFASLAEMGRRVGETDRSFSRPTQVPHAPQTQVPTATMAAATTIVLPPKPQPQGEWAGRLALAGVMIAVMAFVWAAVFLDGEWMRMLPAFVLATAATWGIVGLGQKWTRPADDSFHRRFVLGVFGVLLGLAAVWLEGYSLIGGERALDPWVRKMDGPPRSRFFGAWYPNNSAITLAVGHMAYYGLMLAIIRWWHFVAPFRPARIEWGSVVSVGFFAFVLLFLLPTSDERLVGFTTMTMSAIVVQAVSPRRDPEPAPSKRQRLRWAGGH